MYVKQRMPVEPLAMTNAGDEDMRVNILYYLTFFITLNLLKNQMLIHFFTYSNRIFQFCFSFL